MASQVSSDQAYARSRLSKTPPRSHLILLPLEDLRPTQVAVGMQAVKFKRRKLEKRVSRQKGLKEILERRSIPAVRGPGGDLYMIDRHHFALALWQAEIEQAFAYVIDDFSDLPAALFWRRMERKGLLFPYDETGQRVSPRLLPKSLGGLRHDPYRDLAWEVREAGGFEKSPRPFAEFRWAMFFRDMIPVRLISREPGTAFKKAMKLCRSEATTHLPGRIC